MQIFHETPIPACRDPSGPAPDPGRAAPKSSRATLAWSTAGLQPRRQGAGHRQLRQHRQALGLRQPARNLQTLKGHTAPVYCVAFSPDGKLLASSSQDKTIRLWNPADGKLIREMKGHTDIVDSIAFSPDGKLLASGSADKSVRLWNPADGKEVKNLGSHGIGLRRRLQPG